MSRKEIERMGAILGGMLNYVLELEGVPRKIRGLYCSQFDRGKFGKSFNYSIIATAVGYERNLKSHLTNPYVEPFTKQEDLSRYLARIPILVTNSFPHDMMKNELARKTTAIVMLNTQKAGVK